MERVEQDDGDGYLNTNYEKGGIDKSEVGNEDYDTTPGKAPPVRGIGLRVTNIEGIPLLPRRGMYSTNNVSVIDGLEAISKPVDLEYKGSGGSFQSKPVEDYDYPAYSHENPGLGNINLNMNDSSSSQVAESGNAAVKPLSFVKIVQKQQEVTKVNFRPMETLEKMEGIDVVIPISSVNDRFANTLYGYFLGKRLAFPVVDYFVKNAWAKYGLTRMMMNSKGFFFFKFKTKRSMEQLLEDGPWTIRNVPIILNEWTPSTTLVKEDITAIPLWVKMHDIPLTAFTEDGLSLLASKIGVPKMLDSYTSTMCAESWGRSSFARALIEVNAGDDLKRSIKIVVPSLEGNGYSKAEIKVEYDWEPLKCSTCCVFGHDVNECPKKPKVVAEGGGGGRIKEWRDLRNQRVRAKKEVSKGFS
ncbi:putative transcription factor interactor and regulator CCHC(Zn) family [Helianthus annuus]|nr:putative transcription factor interactor and regulator CCHC(Zn) family [Helianthus annuus]